MANVVQNYIEAQQKMFNYFKCKDDYVVKVMTGYEWAIKQDENISILTYWKKNAPDTMRDAVIVRKDGTPEIFTNTNYTMIIVIDCIKIAFVMKTNQSEKTK